MSNPAATSDSAEMNGSIPSTSGRNVAPAAAAPFPEVLRAILSPGVKASLRLTPHGGRLTGPRAHLTPELRSGVKAHRGRLTTLAKIMKRAGDERGRSLVYAFQTWPGDLEAGFLTCWFAEFGGQLKSEDPFELPPASTITDPPRFFDSVHARLRRLQREGDLPVASKATLRAQLTRLYKRFGCRAEALPDPTGTRPPVVEEPVPERRQRPRLADANVSKAA